MTHHTLKANCQTVHLGGFSDKLPPAAIVRSGDRLSVETYTGYYIYAQAPSEFLTPEFVEICHHLPPERKVGPGPHLLTGPVYIQEAEPGDILEINLENISPSLPIGFNAIRPGWGALPDRFNDAALRFIPLNLEKQIAEFPLNSGIQIPLKPFFGILAVAPANSPQSSIPPGYYGGNMDNRELQVGSRVFLPVLVPGALFSIGDGHSAQGDGEVNGTAIETSMKGTIQLNLHKNLKLPVPMASTPNDIITMGFGDNLDAALEQALKNAIDFLVDFGGLTSEDAYIFCSLAVNFHITQVVNSPQKGVSGRLPKSILAGKINL